MKKNKILIFSLILTLLFSSVSFAINNNDAKAKEKERKEKIEVMVDSGLSEEDANFNLELEEKLKNVKNKIEIGDHTPEISVAMYKDKSKFKKALLLLDEAALKKALEAEVHERGMEDVAKLIEENPGKPKYRIDYDDGSWIQITDTIRRLDEPSVEQAITNFYESTVIGSGAVGNGNYDRIYEVVLSATGSYAKNWLRVKYTQSGLTSNNTATANIYYIEGNQAGHGMISVSNANPNTSGSRTATAIFDDGYWQDNTPPADAYNQVLFAVSGSITIFGTITATVNTSWTQTLRAEYYGTGFWRTLLTVYY